MPNALPSNMITGEGYRITVLTERLVRVEKQRNGIFCDAATQHILNRNFPEVKFSVEEEGRMMIISTSWAKYYFDPMSQKITSVFLDGQWVYVGRAKNLGGTCRTLDNTFGRVSVGDGLLARKGVSRIIDDGLILNEKGEVEPRKAPERDEYIFAYGRNYRDAIADYFYMTGGVPFLPRYVFGNWWSRYHAYTQKEYLDLFEKFEKHNLPFTVATVDMDWHWVRVNEHFPKEEYGQYGDFRGGWTGYSWNTELFPDYKDFLKTLHDKKLHVTLNLHPAQGVRCFEDKYEEMAKAMGVDPKTKETVPFDFTDNNYINNYFDILHHPLEKDGVDFWWIDWQQGKKTKIKGLDPLWSLNHYHYLDSARDGKRGLILSRYCGIGSHRYPLGFSGDTFVRWSALKFQPEFTNMSANIGYGWWSHDIGGHMFGFTDDEMYVRWCQYGAFSPINRLHSSNNELQAKEPWKHSAQAERTVSDYLRLRHALIPYIYTASYEAYTTGRALCEPMYYSYPHNKEAYKVPNQYTFGTQLIVSPITERMNKKLFMGRAKVWLPEGDYYTDMFTGRRYKGGKTFFAYRDTETIPVFAKAGAILPMSGDGGNDCGNPKVLKVWVYRGDGEYTLFEDDGVSQGYKDGRYMTTRFTVREDGAKVRFCICPSEGDLSFMPEGRKIVVCFRDIVGAEKVTVGGEERDFAEEIVLDATPEKETVIELAGCSVRDNGDVIENTKVVLSRWQKGNYAKRFFYRSLENVDSTEEYIKGVRKNIWFPRFLKQACEEQFLQ